jgi:MazG family protein
MEPSSMIKADSFSGVDGLISLIAALRGENGCPWDRRQTPESMAVYLIEEMYELVEAINEGDPDNICEELGDVLFHILFIVRFFAERGFFDINTVTERILTKMVRRHPHVFSNATVSDAEEVKAQWHKIKEKEKISLKSESLSLLNSIPKALPALMRAYRVSDRAARAGFEWTEVDGVIQKAEEEWMEFQDELSKNRPTKNLPIEFGDLLFTLVNVARFAGIHPEMALKDATEKFENRFRIMERQIDQQGKTATEISRKEWDRLWDDAKSG